MVNVVAAKDLFSVQDLSKSKKKPAKPTVAAAASKAKARDQKDEAADAAARPTVKTFLVVTLEGERKEVRKRLCLPFPVSLCTLLLLCLITESTAQ